MENAIKKRNYTLDVIRIVAVLAVVMIHCSAPFITGYQRNTEEFIFGNLFNGLSRVGVPLFLMISGSLFLDESKEITLYRLVSKNVKTIAVLTIVWAVIYSMVYNVASPILKGTPIQIKSIILGIVNGHGHMWYLYMIMGVYITTPFLRGFVRKETKDLVLFFIFFSFIVQFLLPVADKFCILALNFDLLGTWINKFHLDFFGGYITYYLTGWYIVHIGLNRKPLKYALYFLGLSSLVFMVLYVQFTGDYKTAYADIGAPVFLYSLSLFLALNTVKYDFKDSTVRKIIRLSELSFGVYIIHVLVMSVFIELFPYSEHFLFYIIIYFVTVTICSFLCVSVMSKMPFIKKLIKM